MQSALLEAMEERHVTVAGKRYDLPPLFMVLATQNPIEQEGTYPLPEAQMDRFLMHVRIDYPSDADEVKVLQLVRAEKAHGAADAAAAPAKIPQKAVFDARAEIDRVTTKEAVETYMVGAGRGDAPAGRVRRPAQELDRDRREPARLARRSTARSRVYAWLQGRDYVTPEDVQAVAHDCLRHRAVAELRGGRRRRDGRRGDRRGLEAGRRGGLARRVHGADAGTR